MVTGKSIAGLMCGLCLLVLEAGAAQKRKTVPLLKERPDWLQLCQRDDPKLNDCMIELFKKMFPAMATGIPEINVDRFEPLQLDRVSISKGSGGVTLTGSLYNLTVNGPSKAVPTYADLDIKSKKFNFGIDLPLLDIKSMYNLKGNILVLPVIGHGKADLVLHNVRTDIKTDISFPVVEGRQIFQVDRMKVLFSLSSMKINLQNLFNGNKILGNTVNSFLNQNALEVVGELSDNIGSSLAAIFKDLTNNIFSKLPTDLWLPQKGSETVTIKDEQNKETIQQRPEKSS